MLLLSDRVDDEELPSDRCLLRTGLRSLIRDDIEEEFAHLDNLRRVVELRALMEPREKLGILLQPDPDPDGIACGYALRALLGRKRPTAPLISFGEVTRPENRAMVAALGIDVRTITAEEFVEFDALALLDVQPTVFGDDPPARLRSVDLVIDHHPERPGYDAVIKDIRPDVRRHLDDPHRVRARLRDRARPAPRHGARLRHQERHPIARPRDEPPGHRRLRLPARVSQPGAAAPDRAARAPDRRACARSAARSRRATSRTASTCWCSAACART